MQTTIDQNYTKERVGHIMRTFIQINLVIEANVFAFFAFVVFALFKNDSFEWVHISKGNLFLYCN